MPAWVKWLAGYGLKKMPGTSQRSPSSATIAVGVVVRRRRTREEAEAALEHGRRPGDARARPAARRRSPACAAQPQWMRFTVPPVRLASITPAAMLTAMPIACMTPVGVEPEQNRGRDRGAADRAADRGRVPAALEEDVVARVPVVAGHAEPDADLDADGDRGDRLAAVAPGGLGHRQRGGHDRGARVEHRRQVGVVEVEASGRACR